uniref:E3 UFM1-protein ligase 1 homolog n=1 Tax=Rhodnius prolixus TaxID=13249 RepID=R4G486_RHOPR
MTAGDWDEVKRLAADFRRAQLVSTVQTLSERNCIEIITKLIEINLLDVIFTTDGKEYITPQYLIKEIKDELYVSGGRINLVELSKTLNVDLSHITARIPEVERSSAGCTLIMGQLITKQYQKTIAEEINKKLQSTGQINVGDLTKVYDLPGDYLQDVVENLGKIIVGKQDKTDSRIFYTEAFLERNKCLLRGTLRAFTKPTQVSVILTITQLQSRDFYFAFDSLADDKEVCGSLTARQGGNAMFIPHIYTKQLNEWVENFYAQNGYLEYDALNRLGISEPKSFIRRHFASSGLLELCTCMIGPQLLNQVEATVEETLRTGSCIDVMMLVPSVLSTSDIRAVLNEVMKKIKNTTAHIFCDTVFITDAFLQELAKGFHTSGFLQNKAELAVSTGAYIQAQAEKKLGRNLASGNKEKEENPGKVEKREERRRKAAGGKSGGGTQGRETKTKSVKKKGHGKEQIAESDSDNEAFIKKEPLGKLEIIKVSEVEELLSKTNTDIMDIEGLVAEIAAYLHPILNKEAISLASAAYEKTMISSVGDRRKAHVDLQDKVDLWIMELRLSDRGLKLFNDKDDQAKLSSYVIKTTGLQLINAIFTYATQDINHPSINVSVTKEFTPEMRTKLLSELSSEVREPLTKLNKCLAGNSVDEFLLTVEPALCAVGLLSRKPDKKKEKQFLQTRRELLLTQLVHSDSPATVLLVGLLLIFQVATQNVLNASGKFVSIILPFLKPYLTAEVYQTLMKFQDLVVQLWAVDNNEEIENKLRSELNETMQEIKDICSDFRKPLQ